MSRWNGDPLIELKPLFQRKYKTIFPMKFNTDFFMITTKWAQEGSRQLAAKQAA